MLEPRRFSAARRGLERNGLVTRRVIDGRVIGVEHALADPGRSLHDPCLALFAWTKARVRELRRHRQKYDAGRLD